MRGDDDEHFTLDMHHFDSPRSHHPSEIDPFNKHGQAEAEHRPHEADFKTFDYDRYRADEDHERHRRKELKKLLDNQRKIEQEEEERRKIQAEKQRKIDEENERKRIAQEKIDQQAEHERLIEQQAKDA